MRLSIGKAWEETSAFLGREARLVAPVALATFALPAILSQWAFPAGATGRGVGWIMLLVLMVVMIGQMTVILLVNGWRGSIGEAMGKALRRLPTLLGTLAIVFLPLMLVAGIGLAAALIGAGLTTPAAMTPEALAKVPGVAWILLIFTVLALYLAVRIFPISAVVASEAQGPIGSLKRAWGLTKGNFWRLLAFVMLISIGGLVLDWAATAVFGSLATLTAGEAQPFNTTALVVGLASGLTGALVSSVSSAMSGRIYAQLSAPEATVPST